MLNFRYTTRHSSHLPILIKVLQISQGPVLELGAGVFSTPVVHWLCLEAKRPLVTYENDQQHFTMNQAFATPEHQVKFVNNWDEANIDTTHWGLVFVDHEPGARRVVEIARVAQKADYVVVHDTEPNHDYKYNFINKAFPLFKYRYNYKRRKPYTTVLSNFKDLANL